VARRELACEARRQQYYRRSLVRLCFHVAMGGYSISKENRKDVELEVEKKKTEENQMEAGKQLALAIETDRFSSLLRNRNPI